MKITRLLVLAVAATALTACGKASDTRKASARVNVAASDKAYETGD